MYERMFWEDFWNMPSVSFSRRIVDTNKYDIINGELVERQDYKKKLLNAELESLNSFVSVYEKALVEKAQRKEEIEQELKKME